MLPSGCKIAVGTQTDAGELRMIANDWKRRAKLFVQRFWQPTSACMSCMPGSWSNVWSAVHWEIALRTGVATGILAVLLTFTPAARLYSNRFGNALIVGGLTMIGDAYSHENHYGGIPYAEAIVTGMVSALITLAGSYLFEDRARRLRLAWARVAG
jgi:peptidoglycan/LPS O-acetylase OafA/YrhL